MRQRLVGLGGSLVMGTGQRMPGRSAAAGCDNASRTLTVTTLRVDTLVETLDLELSGWRTKE